MEVLINRLIYYYRENGDHGDEMQSQIETLIGNNRVTLVNSASDGSNTEDVNEHFSDARQNFIDNEREMILLRKEIELANREIELLTRENELLNNRGGQSSANSNNLFDIFKRSYEYEALLDTFSAKPDECFDIWFKQLSSIRIKHKLSDNLTRSLITKKLSGRAMSWLRSKPEHIECTVDELLNEMSKLFGSRSDILSKRRIFEKRLWKFNEKFSEYFYDKVIKGNEINITESELVEFIIDGIQNVNLQNQARSLQFKSPDEFLKSFSNVTYPNLNRYTGDQTKFKEPIIQSSTFKPRSAPEQKRTQQASTSKDDNLNRKCFNCNQVGHSYISCPTIRCLNCNNKGHYYKLCPKAKREKGSCYTCGDSTHKQKDCKKDSTTPNLS